MNIRKIPAFLLAALFAIALCGCNSGSENSSDTDKSSSTNSSTSSDNSSRTGSTPVYPLPSDATFLKGAAGDVIGLSEITGVWDLENCEISPESLTEENFFIATTGSAYYALPLYQCLTDRDNEYDENDLLFKDAPQGSQSDFIKVKKGDTIFGMTVAEASSEFNLNSPVPGVVVSTSLTLEGEITLTGYVRVIPGDEYGVAVGDILFLPVGNVRLPVVRFDGCNKDGVILRRTGDVYIMGGGSADDSITFTNEFTERFTLGNVNSTAADISVIPTDGSFIKVNVTISNIKMNSSANWITQIRADIVSISA